MHQFQFNAADVGVTSSVRRVKWILLSWLRDANRLGLIFYRQNCSYSLDGNSGLHFAPIYTAGRQRRFYHNQYKGFIHKATTPGRSWCEPNPLVWHFHYCLKWNNKVLVVFFQMLICGWETLCTSALNLLGLGILKNSHETLRKYQGINLERGCR